MNPRDRIRVAIIAAVTVVTLGIHYGWIIEPIFGHIHWLHAVHGRFCYIPIMVAASWFGLRGGLYTATAITILVLPLILRTVSDSSSLATEISEVVFYYMFAVLIGGLVDREYKARRLQLQAEQQMERSQKLSLVGQIAAGVAHEIKNPLASIKGAADILTDDGTPRSEREEFKEILRNEVRRIDSTVSEFLEFARPRETRRASMNLSDAVHQTVRQVEAQAAQEGVALASSVSAGLIVHGDREKLQQMTLNLLLNAVQASKPGEEITVGVDAVGGAARVVIEDRGPGIPAQDVERIFEPFFTTRPSGTGLGLAVVRAIVDAHEGEIRVESARGGGTRVEVRMPLVEVRAS